MFTAKEVLEFAGAFAPLLVYLGVEIGRVFGRREERRKTLELTLPMVDYVPPVRRAVFLGGSHFVFARDEGGRIIAHSRKPRGHWRN